MNISVPPGAALAASAPFRAPAKPSAILAAAQQILPHLERGQRIDAVLLRVAMENAFGGSDADGAWDWKTAYDACEAATVLFLRRNAPGAARASPVSHGTASDPRPDRGASAEPYAPFRREPGVAAILDADRAWPRCERRRRADVGRSRPGAVGGDRAPRHPRRARGSVAVPQRIRGDPSYPSRPAVSSRARQPLRRRADPRSPGYCDSA